MLCYCPNCEKKFKHWLEEKYKSIAKLNISWNRNYISFDDVELPKTRNTFNDVIDWRMFFVYTIGENVKRRFEIARAEDKGKHPLMCHHVFIQGFPVTSTASDPWNVGRFGDLHGFTQMDDMAMIDILRSCAKDKPVISAEMLMLPGYTLDLPKAIDADDIKKFIFSGVAGNQKGFIFWQYRPEILGRETPTWGLSFLDGEETPWLKAFSESGLVLQKNAEFILDAAPKKAEVAILYNPENQIFAWASTGNEKTATDSLLGYHRALYERNYLVDFIHPIEFEKDILSNYKVLIIPFPYVINKTIADKIIHWVENGGVLITESYTAGWNIEKGHHEKVVPGYGLDKVFKIKQSLVEPADEGVVNIKMDKDLPFIKKNENVTGALVKETFFNQGAEVLASFDCDKAAITLSKFGKGKAIQIGSYVALEYHRKREINNGNLLAGLVEFTSNISKPFIPENKKIRVDVLSKNDEKMVIVQNLEKMDVNVTIKIPGEKFISLVEQFSGDKVKCKNIGAGVEFKLDLYPKEVRVYRA
jgi:beta-galactosidase